MSTTVVLPVDDAAIARAAAALRQGAIVAYPTDTVYGVGALVGRPEAVRRLYTVKGRPLDRPLPVLIADLSQIPSVARELPPIGRCLAGHFWPGGLTLVLPRAPALPAVVAAGRATIGVRLPDHAVARALIRRAGAPLVGTSANLTGLPSPTTAAEVAAQLDGRIDLILDGGPAPGGVESTVVDLTTDPPRIRRIGAVSVEALQAACPELVVDREA